MATFKSINHAEEGTVQSQRDVESSIELLAQSMRDWRPVVVNVETKKDYWKYLIAALLAADLATRLYLQGIP